MKTVSYNEFRVNGIASLRGNSAEAVLKGIYLPRGTSSALKVYKPKYHGSEKSEAAVLERLADTSYVPELIGTGQTPDDLDLPILHGTEAEYESYSSHYTISLSHPFLADEWVNGEKIFHLLEGGGTTMRVEGNAIIHQYLDFIDKCARKGIGLGDLKDVMWRPDKKRICFPDVGNQLPEGFDKENYMIKQFIAYTLSEAQRELGIVKHYVIGGTAFHVGHDDFYMPASISQANKDVLELADRAGRNGYTNKMDMLERDLVRLMERRGYFMGRDDFTLTLPSKSESEYMSSYDLSQFEARRKTLDRFNSGGPNVDSGEFRRTFFGCHPEAMAELSELWADTYLRGVPRERVVKAIKSYLSRKGMKLEDIVND